MKAEHHKITVSYLRLNVQLAELNTVQSIYCAEYGKHLKQMIFKLNKIFVNLCGHIHTHTYIYIHIYIYIYIYIYHYARSLKSTE